jgi:hypothetical protein
VEVETVHGWRAVLPADTYISFQTLHENQDLQVIADKGNPDVVRIVMPDGAQAALDGGNSVRVEFFRDHSYNLFARGATQARTADGTSQTLNTLLPPLCGGPIVQATNQQGQVRLRRMTPSTQVRLAEDPNHSVSAWFEQKQTVLEPDAPQRFTQRNGASLGLTRTKQGVRFEVQRGYFIVDIPGVPGCQPHLWTGQSGQLRWDTELAALEVTPDNSPILVSLPNQSHATVQPGSSLQVAQLGEHTFAASANGKGVEMYDPRTRRQITLSPIQTVMQPKTIASANNRILIAVATDATGQFTLTEPSGRQQRLTKVEEDWLVDPEHTLRGRHDKDKMLLQLQALAGMFSIEIPAVQVSFELNEPNGMKWQIGPDQPTTIGSPFETNPSVVAIRTPSGQILLSPGGEVLVIGPNWTTGMPIIFSNALEPAGEPVSSTSPSIETTGSSWLLGLDPNQIYTPRVEQPPVSVVR